MEEELMTVMEAAKALDITKAAIYNRINRNTYPFEMRDGKIFISRETVDEELAERRGRISP